MVKPARVAPLTDSSSITPKSLGGGSVIET